MSIETNNSSNGGSSNRIASNFQIVFWFCGRVVQSHVVNLYALVLWVQNILGHGAEHPGKLVICK